MNFRQVLLGFSAVVAAVLGLLVYASAQGTSQGVLITASGKHPIDIEVADQPETRTVGLMNRPSMPSNHGMLFEFGEPQEVTMWMKNTLIPLDMLFMKGDGTVTRIAPNAKPLSTDLISSGGPVRYVLELNGGAAARYGAKAGDRLVHPIITGK